MLPTVTIEGRLVADPDLRFTNNGRGVANVRVAANDSRKLDDGTWENTEQIFISCPVWNTERQPSIAETTAEVLHKGDRVIVVGRIYEREYEVNGEKRKTMEMKFPTIARVVEGPRQGSGGTAQAPPQQQSAPIDPWGAPAASNEDPPF